MMHILKVVILLVATSALASSQSIGLIDFDPIIITGPRSFIASWNTLSNVNGYRVRLTNNVDSSERHFFISGQNTTSYDFTGLTPHDYTTSNGVQFLLRVAGEDTFNVEMGEFSNVNVILPECPGLCNYQTHTHSQSTCSASASSDVMCVCNPAYSGDACNIPTFVPRMVEFRPSAIVSEQLYNLEVTWLSPNTTRLDGRLVSSFSVEIRDLTVSGSMAFGYTVSDTGNDSIALFSSYSQEVVNLQSDHDYSISVSTLSDVLLDPPAQITLNYLLELAVPGYVQNIRFNANFLGSNLLVEWDAPENAPSPDSILAIREYIIVVYDEDLVSVANGTIVPIQPAYLFQYDGIILRNTLYNVSVRARNDVGLGRPGFNIVTTPPLVCGEGQYGLKTFYQCSNCPSNSNSPPGSEFISNCTCDVGYMPVFTSQSDFSCIVCNGGDVRLVNGGNEFEGRVEVCINNQWGTVCDDGWDLSDASVVCSQLGYGPAISAPNSAMFGQGSGPIHLDSVACTGSEARLIDCSYDSSNNCGHVEDASAVCNSTTNELAVPGRVQNIQFTGLLAGGLQIEWEDPANDPSPDSPLAIREFLIIFYDEDSSIVYNITTSAIYMRQLHIPYQSDLIQRGTLYNVSLAARNDNGLGPPAFAVTVTPPLVCGVGEYGLRTFYQCTDCPENSNSPEESEFISNCTCNQGLEAVYITPTNFTCQESVPPAPSCPGLTLSNGEVFFTVGNGQTVGSVARFSCNSGFILVNAENTMVSETTTRTCVEGPDGLEWTGVELFCIVVCPSISEDNGQVSYSNTERIVSSTATVMCDMGFVLSGMDTITCTENSDGSGEWSPSVPVCHNAALTCPEQPQIENGGLIYSQSVYNVGTEITYSCDSGYSLSGSDTQTCTATLPTASWDGSQPQCVMTICQPLSVVNGSIRYSPDDDSGQYPVGTVAHYSCEEGSRLVGGFGRTCVDSIRTGSGAGVWNGSDITCELGVTPCPLQFINNGTVEYSPDGLIATYVCDPGFVRTFSRQTDECIYFTIGENTYVWFRDNPPRCLSVTCPVLPEPDNGRISYSQSVVDDELPYETSAVYLCDPGYSLENYTGRTCEDLEYSDGSSTGSWSGNMSPFCQECPLGEFKAGFSAAPCFPCQQYYTTQSTASSSCDRCTYSSLLPQDGFCYGFNTTHNILPPSQSDATVTNEGAVSLTLRWTTAPGQALDYLGSVLGPITNIRIYCRANGGLDAEAHNDSLPIIQLDRTRVSTSVELLPLVSYQFEIVLYGSVPPVEGPPSETLEFITPTAPDDPRLPSIKSLVGTPPTGYTVGYQMDTDLPEIISTLAVEYFSDLDTNMTFTSYASSPISPVDFIFTEVFLDTGYRVTFTLVTTIGLYTYRSPPYVLQPSMLAAPTIDQSQSVVLNSTAVYLQWSVIPGAAVYVVIIDRIRSDGGPPERLNNVRVDGTSVEVGGLSGGQEYVFRVAAEDEQGIPGELSNTLSLTTSVSIPGPPESVMVEIDGSFLIITWSPPSMPNGEITGYIVTLTLLDGTTTFTTLELTFRVPKPDAAFSIGVQAVNEVGSSTMAFAVDPVTPEPTPGQEVLSLPIIIVIAVVGGGGVLLVLVIVIVITCCCVCRKQHSKKGFEVNTAYAVQNRGFGENVALESAHHWGHQATISMGQPGIPPAIPNRYVNKGEAAVEMYAEVNEMKMMKARESLSQPAALPYETFLPTRDATPADYDNEELYMEMGKIYYADIDKTNILARYEVNPAEITIESDLGKGQFGKVSRAKMKKIEPGKAESWVAVKMLKEGANEKSRKDFLGEAQMLATFDHPNVMGLLKVVTLSEPVMVVIPFMKNGDLKNFLKNKKRSSMKRQNSTSSLGGSVFGVMEQMFIAEQIAAGMEYLAAKFFIHRDLAARNILVGENNHCKIADFGLSRALAQEDTYYHVSASSLLPVKWMAIESILYRKFSSYSDVWSFGIVLWEIFSFGAVPYKGISAADVPNYVQSGNRLECPEKCPSEVYEMMKKCWDDDKEKRSTFSSIKFRLKAITISLRRAADKNHPIEPEEEDEYIN